MEPEKAHHCVLRLSATDLPARVRVGDRELAAGPTLLDGNADWWRCEQLLVGAAAVSLLSSFHEHARQERLATGAFNCVAEAVFHQGQDGHGPALARMLLRVELEAPPRDLARAEQILHRAKETCMAARALRVPLELQITPLPSGATQHSTVAS
jgi:organic hydroperoxide reductase OsmC/OhrA